MTITITNKVAPRLRSAARTYFPILSRKYIIVMVMVIVGIAITMPAFAQTETPPECPKGQTCLIVDLPVIGDKVTNPGEYIAGLYRLALGAGGLFAMLFIVYGGIRWAASRGNPSAIGEAKSIITSAIWGLVLLLGAFLILNTINPSLTNLELEKLDTKGIEGLKGGGLKDLAGIIESTSKALEETKSRVDSFEQSQIAKEADLDAAIRNGEDPAIIAQKGVDFWEGQVQFLTELFQKNQLEIQQQEAIREQQGPDHPHYEDTNDVLFFLRGEERTRIYRALQNARQELGAAQQELAQHQNL